jgi:hypothetical protein
MHLNGHWEIYNGDKYIGDVYNIEEADKAAANGYRVIWRASK